MSSSRRFPVKRQVYMQTTGRLLPRRISQMLRDLNRSFGVWVNPSQGNGIDLKVWYGDILILAGEVLNWSLYSLMPEKRRSRIIQNLREFNCKRLVIYSVLDAKSLSILSQAGIDLLEIGYQLLPLPYFLFFLERGQAERRKPDSDLTRQDIQQKLTEFLKKHFPHISICFKDQFELLLPQVTPYASQLGPMLQEEVIT